MIIMKTLTVIHISTSKHITSVGESGVIWACGEVETPTLNKIGDMSTHIFEDLTILLTLWWRKAYGILGDYSGSKKQFFAVQSDLFMFKDSCFLCLNDLGKSWPNG